MPYYNAPSNDQARFTFLNRAIQTATEDEALGTLYLSTETKTAITTLLPTLEAALLAISEKTSTRSKEIRERLEAIEVAKTYLRHLWTVVKLRVQRLNQPAEVLTFYQLPLSGLVPNPNTQEEWLTLATNVVQGDALAVAAGYPAMANPTAAELQAVLTTAKAEAADVAGADAALDKAQEDLAALRTQADALIVDVTAELRFHLRRKDNASQRRIMRRYGATFTYLSGEPIDELEVPLEADSPGQ